MSNRCEIPGCKYQPFDKDSGEQYSEAHHIIPIGRTGSESHKNLAILCPNHHREIHYGVNRNELTRLLASMKSLFPHWPASQRTSPDITKLYLNIVHWWVALVSFHRIITNDTRMKFYNKWRVCYWFSWLWQFSFLNAYHQAIIPACAPTTVT